MSEQTPNKTDFRSDLERLLNCRSMESGSDTPDFILADYLMRALNAYDAAVIDREKWYERARENSATQDAKAGQSASDGNGLNEAAVPASAETGAVEEPAVITFWRALPSVRNHDYAATILPYIDSLQSRLRDAEQRCERMENAMNEAIVSLQDQHESALTAAREQAAQSAADYEGCRDTLRDERTVHSQTVQRLKQAASEEIQAANQRAAQSAAECERYKKDAERYRWLRNSHNQGANSPTGEGIMVVTDRPAKTPRYIGPVWEGTLDAAIDQALASRESIEKERGR